jgi:hypothetical protein
MTEDFSKKAFVFVFQLETTIYSSTRILMLFLERSIEIDEFHYHTTGIKQGRLVIHCQLEKDRIGRTASLLDKLPGVIHLDWMESKRHGSTILK